MTPKQVVVFSLLLNKIYISWKTELTSPIVDALLRHGSLYYLTVISMLVFTVVSATMNTLFWPIMDSECASFILLPSPTH
jgi:alkylated DNA repair dioxygenase AlkB